MSHTNRSRFARLAIVTALAVLVSNAAPLAQRYRGNVRASSRTSVNRNVNRNTNINRNIDVDRDVNVNVHSDRYCCGCCYRSGWGTAAAVATTAVVTAAVVGSVVHTLPPSCTVVVVNGFAYQQCGSVWYQPQITGSTTTYVVINAPR
jgi:hypothetical protein